MPVITEADVRDQYRIYTGREPSRAEIDRHLGQTVPDIPTAARNFFLGPPPAPSGGGGFPDFSELLSGLSMPGLSGEEKALIKQQTELIKLQMEDLKRQNELNAQLFPLQKELFEFQLKFARDLFPQQQAMIERLVQDLQPSATETEIKRLSDERALASLRGEPIPLSAQQQAQLDTIYNQAGEQGAQDIRQFAEEMAAARGLRLTDTPIGDVALRQARDLFAGLEASKAQAALDLGQSQQVFSEGVRQFQAGLQQQALQNRLALAAGASNQPALGAVNAAPLIGSFQGSLATMAQNRAAQGQFALGVAGLGLQQRQFQEQMNQANLDRLSRERIAQWGMQGSGGGAGGFNPSTLQWVSSLAPVAAAGLNAAGSIWSTARVKTDITPLDEAEFRAAARHRGLPVDAYDEALADLKGTPISRWRYRWESPDSKPHIGPILELAPPDLTEDGWHLRVPDYVGLLHAGLKGLARQVDRLEAEAEAA